VWEKKEAGGDEQQGKLVEFKGKGGESVWILLRNLFLTLLTLGIYSFWGKTRARAYLWSRTELLGEPLEYTGTGKELFISFLIVMPAFLVLTVLAALLVQLVLGPFAVILFYSGLLYAWQFAAYRALRYRLTRTRWRGIRGNLDGSALSYAWQGTLYWLAIYCSLGLALPWAVARMTSLKLNNVRFGNRKFDFSGQAKDLYKIYLALVLGVVALSCLFFGGFFYRHVSTGSLPPLGQYYYFELTGMFLLYSLAIFLLSAFYRAAYFRWLAGHSVFGAMRTASTLSGARYFKVSFGNLVLLVLTVGIGYAWVVIRDLRARLDSLVYTGDPQFDTLGQDSLPAPKRGEGLLEALDADLGF
jgi:uncharacterized membrane protein YjgN (DUF898 family)